MALVEFLEENAVIGAATVENGQITNAKDFGTILNDTRVHVPRDPSRELTPADGDAYLAALLFTFDGRIRARVTPPPSALQVRSFIAKRHGDHDQSSHGNRDGAGGGEDKGDMARYTSLDIKGRRDEFKKLSDEEKDRLARAETSIPRAIEQRLKGLPDPPTEGNAGERAEARADQYVEAGLVVGEAADLMREQGEQIAGLMGSLNVDPEVSAKLTMNIMDSLAAQEVETMGRVLGDHGVRHAEGNARIALGVLEAVPGLDTAEDKAFAIIVSAYHDLGYLTPPAQVFLDSEHAHWGEQHFDESLRPDIEAAFGKEFADRVGKAIDTHSDTNLDWQNDPQGSALRLADNLALFHAEKLPAICEYVPDNVNVLVNLGRGEITVEEAQTAMRANIDASDHPEPVKERLRAAADEVNPTLPARTVGMLGAKVGDITWEGDHVKVDLIRTPANEALTNVLDMGQSQFDKFAETYNADPEELRSGEPVAFEEDGKVVLTAQVVSSGGSGRRFLIFEIPFAQLVRHGDHDQSTHGHREGAGEGEVKSLSAPSGLSTYDEKANAAMQARAVKEGFGSVEQIAANMETFFGRATRDEIAAGAGWYEHANERAQALAEYAGKDVSVIAGMMARLSPTRDWNDNSFSVNVMTRVLHEDKPFEVTPDRSAKLYEQNALPPGTYTPSELTSAQLAFTHPMFQLPSLQASVESGPQLRDAIDLFRGEKTPDEVLTGPKIRSFYNNIYDPSDPNSVTVDFHMIEAARNGQAWNNTKGEPYQPSGYVSVLTRAPVVKGSLEEGSGLYPYVAEAIFRGAKANNVTPNDYQAIVWSVIVGDKKKLMVLDPYVFDHSIPLADDEDTGVDFMAAPKPLPPIPTESRAVRHGDHDQSTHGNREGGAEPEAKGGETGGSSVLPYGERVGILTVHPVYTPEEKAATEAKLAAAPIKLDGMTYNPEAGSTPSYVVTLADGSKALVKPDSPEAEGAPDVIRSEYMAEGATSAVREMASEAVAEAIGIPFPAVVFRGDITIDDPEHGLINPDATVQHYVEGQPLGWHGGMNSFQMHMVGLFDSIVGNTDRHSGNIIIQPDGNAVPIDHNLTFPDRIGAPVQNDNYNGNFIMLQGDPLTDSDREILAEVQGNNELRATLTDLVGPRAVELMDKRIEYMQMEDRQLMHGDMSTGAGVRVMYGEGFEEEEDPFAGGPLEGMPDIPPGESGWGISE